MIGVGVLEGGRETRERSVCDTFLIACKLPPSLAPLKKGYTLEPVPSLPEKRERERERETSDAAKAATPAEKFNQPHVIPAARIKKKLRLLYTREWQDFPDEILRESGRSLTLNDKDPSLSLSLSPFFFSSLLVAESTV